jgi:hypothetical protein
MLRSLGRRIWLAGALGLALGAAFAGCGGSGGDDGPGEEALRAKIEKGFAQVDQSRSLNAALDIHVGEGGETDVLGGCLKFAIDKGGKSDADDRVDMRAVEGGCDGAAVSGEVIAIGSHLWLREGTGTWSAATVDPALLSETTGQAIDFDQLAGAAEDVSEASQPDEPVYPETSDTFKGPRYSFTAPGSAFSQTEGAGDTDVDFEAALDPKGYLRELLGKVKVDDAEGLIKVTYDNFDHISPITAPPTNQVHGPIQHLHSDSELEALLAGPFGNAF